MISQSNSFATTNTPRNPLQSSVLEKPRIKDLSRGPAKTNKDRRNRKDHPDDENKKKRKNNEKWRLLIYDDKVNTRDRVARVLVEVTGSSEVEAFRITNEAHDTGVAVVGTSFPLEIAEAYNERLRREGITSEIRLVERYGGDIGNWE
jgi:ATP-dependent Clp protease adapter protein ClpS